MVPFNDYLGDLRVDWAQSSSSQWFLRGASDRYTTENDLVQQGTLPSTGATSRSKYFNFVLNNQYEFSPEWLGSFTFGASLLHRTVDRNQYYGFALDFPFTVTSSVITGQDTFGDNTFVTPITAFPVLRNQQKYQFRYDVCHVTGRHSWKFGINFIHEPVLDGVLASEAETVIAYPNNPDFTPLIRRSSTSARSVQSSSPIRTSRAPIRLRGMAASRRTSSASAFTREDIWRVTPHLTLNYGLRWDTTLRAL